MNEANSENQGPEDVPSDQPEVVVPTGPTRCGFCALVGAPNAGKSTLLNAMVGSKISIVSPKVQTTRSRVTGIAMAGACQLIFVDTPGIFSPHKRLERAMVAAAWQGAADADEVVLLVDTARRTVDADTRSIIDRLKQGGRTAILVLNKIDLIRRDKLLGLAETLNQDGIFTEVFMISAETGDGVEDLRAALVRRMPEGPWLFPDDQLSDMPMRLLAAEIVREKLFLQLHQELPHSAAVETEAWEEFDDGSAKIQATITVQRDSQKAIVLGKSGARIKAIGAAAREELEHLMDRRVHLFLHVKVRENWADDPDRYRDWGLDFNA
ncbi:MAG: GTPase Era [Azospirillaceae bacterium]|nr:GTPase Era [Azospirillaceae bacterium]